MTENFDPTLHNAISRIRELEQDVASLKQALHQERVLRQQCNLEKEIQHLPLEARDRLRRAFPGVDLGGLRSAVRVEVRNAIKNT